MKERVVELEGAFNVRDLGGLPTTDGRRTQYGVVYRADSLDNLTSRDEERLFHTLNIREIIDLRTFEEVQAFPHLASIEYRHQIPLIAEGRIGREPFPSEDPEKLAAVYLDNIETGSEAVRTVIELIADATRREEGCLFHCAAGRDRTGVVTALLLDSFKVERESTAIDYEQSNHHAKHVTKKLNESNLYANSNSRSKEIILLRGETILRFLQLLDEKYEGARNYLRIAGVPDYALEEIERSFVSRA